MHTRIRVGTRPSPLALRQVKEIASRMPEVIFEVVAIATKGDKDKTTSLFFQENSDFFTFEIEEALRRGSIDAAVHSAKDLEEDLPEDLRIAAVTASLSRFDCLVSRNDLRLIQLPSGSRVGTSSRNRRQAIEGYRRDLIAKDIRGNVDERLKQLDRGDFEAVVVAQAALLRLGLEERIAQIFPFSVIKPHPLQGKLAVQIRKDRKDIGDIFRRIDESEVR